MASIINFFRGLKNIPGWTTSRKIIVIESDDWGSIRIRNKDAYSNMISAGLELDRSPFTQHDSLESNRDLQNLYEILTKHRDSTGRNPVITPMFVVANPDFDKIKNSGFSVYFYEPFHETYLKYPCHDKAFQLIQTGIHNRLFVPQLHGREHLNVFRWMNALKNGNEGLHLAFNHESIGVGWYKGQKLPEHLAAFHPETPQDIAQYHEIIKEAVDLFHRAFGYNPSHFIAPNSHEPKELEKTFAECGVRFLTRSVYHKYPEGNNKYTLQINWLGRRSYHSQAYLIRNGAFEPAIPGVDWVDSCLADIQTAFRWKKPAIISSHRVNFVGTIDPNNTKNGLKSLNHLLTEIIKKWPEVEFMTSTELGELILGN